MGIYPAEGTPYTCRITQSYHIHNYPLPPHIWLLIFILPKSGLLSVPMSIYPTHANDGSSYHCSDNHQWLLTAQLDPPGSPYDTVVHKVVLGYISPLHGLMILNVSARSALNVTKKFTLKCINSCTQLLIFLYSSLIYTTYPHFIPSNFNDKHTIIN